LRDQKLNGVRTLLKVVHIGHTKTGTTYLQSNVFGPLFLAGLLHNYVGNNGVDRSHSKGTLNHAFSSLGAGTTTDFQAKCLNEFMSSHEDFFISVEGILGNLREQNLDDFASRLSRHVPEDAEIVITLRGLSSLFDSTYQQAVKGDFFEEPSEFFSAVGPKRRQKLRRQNPLTLAKYDLDALVSALLQRFQTVVLIDARQEQYLPWLADHVGKSVEEISKLIAPPSAASKGLNSSLSSSSVRILEKFNLVARYFLMAFGVSKLARLDPMAVRTLRPTEALRYKLLYAVIRVKSKFIGLLRIVDSKPSGAKKYNLPAGLREEILGSIPASNLFVQVEENAGFLKVTRDSGSLRKV
jgi:hypothetical protein